MSSCSADADHSTTPTACTWRVDAATNVAAAQTIHQGMCVVCICVVCICVKMKCFVVLALQRKCPVRTRLQRKYAVRIGVVTNMFCQQLTIVTILGAECILNDGEICITAATSNV